MCGGGGGRSVGCDVGGGGVFENLRDPGVVVVVQQSLPPTI